MADCKRGSSLFWRWYELALELLLERNIQLQLLASGRPAGGINLFLGAHWQEFLALGEANRVTSSSLTQKTEFGPELQWGLLTGTTSETVVTNVTSLASPSVVTDAAGRLILFSLHDPEKPWYAATDIGTLRQTNSEAWTLGRVADDLAAEFSPKVVMVSSDTTLAAWTRVSGDVSGVTNPAQVVPHSEVVAAWCDRKSGAWSVPYRNSTMSSAVDRGAAACALWHNRRHSVDS